MKLRKGFVSNSSSSSFTCDLCNETESGWDLYGKQCVNEHEFCESCEPNIEDAVEKILELADKGDMEAAAKLAGLSVETVKDQHEKGRLEGYFDDGFPGSTCPFCNFTALTEGDMCRYLEKTSGITKVEVFAIVKEANKRRQKLYNHEYIAHVSAKKGVTPTAMLEAIKSQFESYDEFNTFLRSKV